MFGMLSLRVRIFLLFALICLGGSVLFLAGLIIGYLRLSDPAALSSFVIAGVIGICAIFGLSAWVWIKFDDHVAKPVERLAAELRARAHSGVDLEIDREAARFLGDLAPAAAAVTEKLSEARNATAHEVGRAIARTGREKAQLAAMLAEVPTGVVFCGPDDKIRLYNARAQVLLADGAEFGLDRPLGSFLKMSPFRQSYGRLCDAAQQQGSDILVSSGRAARLLEARMRLLAVAEEDASEPGYILTLRDVSSDLAIHAERAHLLSAAIEVGHAAVAALPEGAQTEELGHRLAEIEARKAPTDTQWWPMEALAAADLGAALRQRLSRKGIELTCDLPDLSLRCDGFAIVRLLERIALDWTNAGAGALRLTLVPNPYPGQDEACADLRLLSDAEDPPADLMARWLATPLSPGQCQFSGHDVLHCHGTELRAADGLHLRLMRAKAPYLAPALVEYDFELTRSVVLPDALAGRPLDALTFAVFDSETTGLSPEHDEICQLAAVRVVNGRILEHETFDTLVNPGRPIPKASRDVHGIDTQMVQDAPTPGEVIGAFHAYASGAILVAHNAPFDMAFLRRREAELGKSFDQPILDTVLISAILFGASATHTLDALCKRLDITIPDAARHTALGDALGTAQVLTKTLPMLRARGFGELGQLVKEFDRHSRLIANLN